MTYTVGGDTYQMDFTVPPSIACPNCGACLTVKDTLCGRCERTFHPRELFELYQAHQAGVREGRERIDRAPSTLKEINPPNG